MKINCFDTMVNFEAIRREIDYFRKEHDGNYPSYLIMSHVTRAKIACNSNYWVSEMLDARRGLSSERLYGIPIAFNNGLNDGEIDIV